MCVFLFLQPTAKELAPAIGDASLSHAHHPPALKSNTTVFSGENSAAVWSRFVLTDTTALAARYRSLSIKWLYFPPLLILLKAALLIPAIFLEPRSFEQRVGCAAVEVAIAALVFSTNVYLSPVMLMVLRAASVHQIALLGLQNIDLVTQNTGRGSLAAVMVTVTGAYIIFSCVVFVSTVAWPLLDAALTKRTLKVILRKHGLQYSGAISQYLDPTVVKETTELPSPSAAAEIDFDQTPKAVFLMYDPGSARPAPQDTNEEPLFASVGAIGYDSSFGQIVATKSQSENLGVTVISNRNSVYRFTGPEAGAASSDTETIGHRTSFSPPHISNVVGRQLPSSVPFTEQSLTDPFTSSTAAHLVSKYFAASTSIGKGDQHFDFEQSQSQSAAVDPQNLSATQK
eukprot:GDKK01004970.1.p1 GENE.GDKK01004970.1~~GDKK01004970.1.p1  ORF type:complete len:400 (+),score=26.24 GDKK01004970.1:3-1202(+)